MGLSNLNSAAAPDVSGASGAYRDQYGVSADYQAIINVRGDTSYLGGSKLFPIIAAMPERFNMEFSADWKAPFAGASVGGAIESAAARFGANVSGELINLVSQVSGNATRNKYTSFQVWESSSALQFGLELQFSADRNTESDVRAKQLALLKMCAPYEGPGKMLLPPGPSLAGRGELAAASQESRRTSLTLGRYIHLDDVIIRSVSSDVQWILDKDGRPMLMTIQVQVSSYYESFTVQDIDAMFKGR